ncbi:hypothetical protein GC387_21845 [Pseudomonas sp. MWU12-2323]|nr:hypothetical protein [Pseudomonas sp. MWU12-2323]
MEENTGYSGLDSWPVPVRVFTEKEKLVRLSDLPKSLKLKAWSEIKSSSIALADLLKDTAFRDVVQYFSADIFIEAQHAPCLPQERLRGRNG